MARPYPNIPPVVDKSRSPGFSSRGHMPTAADGGGGRASAAIAVEPRADGTILFKNFVDVRRSEKPTCGLSMQRHGSNQFIVGGEVTLEALPRSLATQLGGV